MSNFLGSIHRQLPFFSELFPGWDPPKIQPSESRSTPDGLGPNSLYLLKVEIIEIYKEYINCRVIGERANGFDDNQVVKVYLPHKTDKDLLKIGNEIMVIYTGADCNVREAVIYARLLTDSIEEATDFAEKFLN